MSNEILIKIEVAYERPSSRTIKMFKQIVNNFEKKDFLNFKYTAFRIVNSKFNFQSLNYVFNFILKLISENHNHKINVEIYSKNGIK